MITPAHVKLVSLFLQNTKSSLWVWTMLERQPSCTSCKWTSRVVKILFTAGLCCNVLFPRWQSDKGSCPHVAHHRKQRGADHRAQNALFGLGYRRAREPPSQLVLLLLQHRGTKTHLACVHQRTRLMLIKFKFSQKPVTAVLTDLKSFRLSSWWWTAPTANASVWPKRSFIECSRTRYNQLSLSSRFRHCAFIASHVLISHKTTNGSVWPEQISRTPRLLSDAQRWNQAAGFCCLVKPVAFNSILPLTGSILESRRGQFLYNLISVVFYV